MIRPLHRENHLIDRIGWLRAAVLGANDGLLSTASLVVGVAAAATAPSEVLVAGAAERFCSRQAWRKQVAYASQFESPKDRAYRGQAKIKSRRIGNCDPDDRELPPKPKWQRWSTYNRHVQQFERYEDIINNILLECSLDS